MHESQTMFGSAHCPLSQEGTHTRLKWSHTKPGSHGSSSSHRLGDDGRHAPRQSVHSGQADVAHALHVLPGPQESHVSLSQAGAHSPV
jgi:hypothetical protein